MRKKERLYVILVVLGFLGLSLALSLYALKDNISYFRSPSDVHALQKENARAVELGRVFRLGGLVLEGSVLRYTEEAAVGFTVTDMKEEVRVYYKGILPDLFREGQGVVATGSLDENGIFQATQLLAKHDENYMPPEVAKALKKAHEEGTGAAPE